MNKRSPLSANLRIYIDMDHTFCDFEDALPFWKSIATTPTESRWPWSQPGFFTTLKPMPGAIDYWKYWEQRADLWFLTKPSIPNLHCYTEKAQWVKKYLGEEGLSKLILSPRKDLLIGDILIDDASNAGQPFFLGKWWQFGSPDCRDWKNAHQMTLEFISSKREIE
jgi:5'-nucleotidase